MEQGIDISHHTSKSLTMFEGQEFDYVITVCDEAYQECPFSPGAKHQLHWSIPDPSYALGSQEERLQAFRKTVDALETRIKELLESINNKKATS